MRDLLVDLYLQPLCTPSNLLPQNLASLAKGYPKRQCTRPSENNEVWEETQYIMESPMKDKAISGYGVTQIILFQKRLKNIVTCFLSKVQCLLGEGWEDLRVRFKKYDLWKSFPIPKILVKIGIPDGSWRIIFSKEWDHMGPSGPSLG